MMCEKGGSLCSHCPSPHSTLGTVSTHDGLEQCNSLNYAGKHGSLASSGIS